MGNCNTDQQQIQQPQVRPMPIQKPTPFLFHIPTHLTDHPATYTSNTGKLTDLITKHQPYLRLDEYEQIKSKLQGKKYTDHQFKPSSASLGQLTSNTKVQWKRPSQMLKKVNVVFEGTIEPQQLKQGKLQNLYFLSSLAAFEHYPHLIKKVLLSDTVSNEGLYGVWLFVNGRWKCVMVDDLFPLAQQQYILNRHRNELWIMLIQKAYAKIFEGYENISCGLSAYIMNALTGAPFQYLNTNSSKSVNANVAWEFIQNSFKQKYLILANSQVYDDGSVPNDAKYSYQIIDYQEVFVLTQTDRRKERILKLANPWGKYEWKGRWSEYSDVWCEELRHQLGYEKADESILWIGIADFLIHFQQICICKYHPSNINSSISVKFSHCQNQFKGVYLHFQHRFEGIISLVQQDFRAHRKNYRYSQSRITLIQISHNNKVKRFMKESSNANYYNSMEVELDPGSYYLLAEMNWSSSNAREIVINTYGDQAVNMIEGDEKISIEGLLYQIAMAKIEEEQKNGKQNSKNYHTYSQDQNIKRLCYEVGGYLIIKYVNQSKENHHLCESMSLGKSQNLSLLNDDIDKLQVNLNPGEQSLIKLKITQGKYVFDPEYSHKVVEKYSPEELVKLTKKKPNQSKQRQIEGKPIDVFVKTFNYSGGVVLLYENKMKLKSYIQQIEFDMKNLKLENEELGEEMKLELELMPNSSKMLSLVVMDMQKDFSFRTKVSYYLAEPEFTF